MRAVVENARVRAFDSLNRRDLAACRKAADRPRELADGCSDRDQLRRLKEKEKERRQLEAEQYKEFIATQYYYYLEVRFRFSP